MSDCSKNGSHEMEWTPIFNMLNGSTLAQSGRCVWCKEPARRIFKCTESLTKDVEWEQRFEEIDIEEVEQIGVNSLTGAKVSRVFCFSHVEERPIDCASRFKN